jgi:hypothetical protein
MALNHDAETGNATRTTEGSTAKMTSATVLGADMQRSTMWLLAASASIILVGHAGVLRSENWFAITLDDETMAILVFGCVGLVTSFLGLLFEKIAPSITENQLVLTLAGLAMVVSGIGTMMTIFFGSLEYVGFAVGAAGLTVIGLSLLGSHVDFIKNRVSSSTSNARHGANTVWLLVSLIAYSMVACINLGNYNDANGPAFGLLYDLLVSSVAIGVLCTVATIVALLRAKQLGEYEKMYYLLLTVVLVIGASMFPLAGWSKPISSAVTLFSAVFFSAQITRTLFINY